MTDPRPASAQEGHRAGGPVLSVVIPAHNEAGSIGGMLRRIVDGDPDGLLELVVAANGCTDGTAAIASAAAPRIRVIEIDEPSKIAALNAGDAATDVLPRAYVDADVRIDASALFALAEALSGADAASAAAPQFIVDTSRSSWPARQYFAVWALSDYNRGNHIGSGVYALSAAGRARFGEFPELIADDRYVEQLFTADERVVLAGHSFTVAAPRTLRAQIRRAVRIQLGNDQLRASGLERAPAPGSGRFGSLIARVARRPRLWIAFPVYCYGYLVPRLTARRLRGRDEPIEWRRDDTARALE